MDYDELFNQYQKAVDAMSDEELIAEFAKMGCDVFIDTNQEDETSFDNYNNKI